MKRKIILTILVVLLVGLYFYADSIRNDQAMFNLGFCDYPDTNCAYDIIVGVIKPLLVCILSLVLVFFSLVFTREEVYKSWLRFAYWAIPISIIILWLAPTSTPGGIGISFLDFTKQTASWLVSSAFLLISLWIIVSRSLHATSK